MFKKILGYLTNSWYSILRMGISLKEGNIMEKINEGLEHMANDILVKK